MFRGVLVVLVLLSGMAAALSPAGTRAQSGGGDWTGSVIVNDGWRVEVIAAAQGASVSDAGLARNADGKWLLLVADVTNWTGDAATFPVDDLSLSADGGDGSGATGTVLSEAPCARGPEWTR